SSMLMNTHPMDHDMSNMDMPMNHAKEQMQMKTKTVPQMSSMSMKNMKAKMGHDGHMMNEGMSMSHGMKMPTESTIIGDSIAPPSMQKGDITTPGNKYQNITASVPTNDPNKPIKGVIRMELFGYMDRFIWFINGLPEYKAKPIVLEPGERYRII